MGVGGEGACVFSLRPEIFAEERVAEVYQVTWPISPARVSGACM